MLAALLGTLIALNLIQPQVVRAFIDGAQRAQDLATLIAFAGIYLALAVLTQVVSVGEDYCAEDLGWRATNALRRDLTRHCLDLDLAFHHLHAPGELAERLDGDVTVLANFFSRFTLQLIGNVLLLAGILVLLFQIDWRIGLLMLGFSAVAFAVLNAFRDPGVHIARASRQASAELSGFLEERLAGQVDIHTSGAQPYVLHSIARLLWATVHFGRLSFLTGSLVWTATALVFTIASAAVLVYTANLFRAGAMTIGTVYLVFQYTTMLRTPIGQISQQARDLQRAAASVARIRELFTVQLAIADGPGALLPASAPAIEAQNVSFCYPATGANGGPTRALHEVSFQVAPGSVLGVLGRTGSGKSTLARLLCRQADPTSGTVRLNNVDLRTFHLAQVCHTVGVVSQEVQLFAASVRDNLTLFDPAIADSQVYDVLDRLELTAWLHRLPAGLDSQIDAAGGGLSGGEAQLLAFARVLLRDPGVVILDEATSRLDPATERRIERTTDLLLRGRTGIVIAHRLSTLDRADTLIVLEGGRIVEHGARTSLAADPSSRYASLRRAMTSEVISA